MGLIRRIDALARKTSDQRRAEALFRLGGWLMNAKARTEQKEYSLRGNCRMDDE